MDAFTSIVPTKTEEETVVINEDGGSGSSGTCIRLWLERDLRHCLSASHRFSGLFTPGTGIHHYLALCTHTHLGDRPSTPHNHTSFFACVRF
uniref:Uncharacterized protein n=1 Tax=Mycena chlorophos TaxID=658473 RepID=A0ABQ0LD99_MYCCL|nr:predicted protein [Mycena chlorophos]